MFSAVVGRVARRKGGKTARRAAHYSPLQNANANFARADLDSVRKLRRREKLSGHCQQQEDEKKLSKCLRADVQHVIADAVVCPTRRHFESFNACLLLLFRGRQTRNNIFTSLHNCAFSLTTSV